jgi:hypothetical protein
MLYEQTCGFYFIFKAVLKEEIDFWFEICSYLFHAYFRNKT